MANRACGTHVLMPRYLPLFVLSFFLLVSSILSLCHQHILTQHALAACKASPWYCTQGLTMVLHACASVTTYASLMAVRCHWISCNVAVSAKPTCLGGKNPKVCTGYRGHRKILLNTLGACTVGTHHFAMGSGSQHCGTSNKRELNTDDAHLRHFRGQCGIGIPRFYNRAMPIPITLVAAACTTTHVRVFKWT